jgi:hypothetical protein
MNYLTQLYLLLTFHGKKREMKKRSIRIDQVCLLILKAIYL